MFILSALVLLFEGMGTEQCQLCSEISRRHFRRAGSLMHQECASAPIADSRMAFPVQACALAYAAMNALWLCRCQGVFPLSVSLHMAGIIPREISETLYQRELIPWSRRLLF